MLNEISLNNNWLMQSSEKVSSYGEKISTKSYVPEDWYSVDIPTTVVNGLVKNKEFVDPYYGTNLQTLPGYKTPVTKQNFESRYKPDNSPFRTSWWFRKEFNIDEKLDQKEYWLKFDGINYSANIWLNGKRVAGTDHVIGTYRQYDFRITRFIEFGKNVLVLEIFSPNPDDLAISFVDWCPLPPDDDMGIWQPAFLYTTGPVAMKHPFIKSKVDIETLKEASLFISTELHNLQKDPVTIIIEGVIDNIIFEKEVKLGPFEKKKNVSFSVEEFPQLKIKNPRLWWPYHFGSPELYELSLTIKQDDEILDAIKVNFGIRDVSASINPHGSLVFRINGQEVLLRGAGWTCDMMLQQSNLKDEIDIAYLKNLNFNVLRLEGKLATDYFWDVCDREGILVLPGWVCCSHWEKWNNWKEGDIIVAEESLRSQILRLRNHPSFIAWFYGSDFPPPGPIERVYLQVLNETYKELPKISSATAQASAILGETGVKMTGPYTYVPPKYWYSKERRGFAESFNTETGPDVCIPPIDSIKKMLPEDQLFVGSGAWNFHAGLGTFKDTTIIEEAVSKRYGESKDIYDFSLTSQLLGYESWRAMYEAHAQNFPKATGVIGWMYNSPWPSLIWQLYDYYLNPNGAFYGSKKACEPIHIQYSYNDASIWVINKTLNKKENLTVKIKVLNIDLEEKLNQTQKVDIDIYGNKKVFTIPEIQDLSSVYFILLILEENSTTISKNLYWLSTKDDVLAAKDEWYYTPVKEHSDMRALRSLPKANIEYTYEITEEKEENIISLIMKNTSDVIAFFIRVDLINETTNNIILPIFWDENYFSLFPSEEVQINGIFPKTAKNIIVRVEGWNF